ncbi:MAG: class I SAM-dependent methyltransferase [Prevotellaceae bacterium]|jgi:hypothetical protein|nr:class I SAM-dependent methyltransferase [Prevotellaceae bacterium]
MPLGEETLHFIRQHQDDDVRRLALLKAPAGVVMSEALTQIAGRQAARSKLPLWHDTEGILYPPHLNMEQCSSEETARYKTDMAQRLGGAHDTLVDLTGGFGVDCTFLAQAFRQATYVERDEALCRVAAHNFGLLAPQVAVRNEEAGHFLHGLRDGSVDLIFLDPARRSRHGSKVAALTDCEPNVTELLPLLRRKARWLLLKLSPMLDVATALQALPTAEEVHLVSVGGECKELLVLAGQTECEADDVPVCCVNLPGQLFRFTRREEAQMPGVYAHALGTYLYEPNASVMKGGAFRRVAHIYKVEQLHPNSHLYTSEERVDGFPGRRFRITGSCGWGKQELKALLGDLKQANIATRNFPATVGDLRRRLKLGDGGDTYLFATTLADGRHVLIKTQKT